MKKMEWCNHSRGGGATSKSIYIIDGKRVAVSISKRRKTKKFYISFQIFDRSKITPQNPIGYKFQEQKGFGEFETLEGAQNCIDKYPKSEEKGK